MAALLDHARVLVVGVFLAGVAAGCGGLPSLDDLNRMPEATLAPEGAQLVSHNEHPRENSPTGPVAAITGNVFGVDLHSDELYAWYGRELEARGWTRDPLDTSGVRTSLETSVRVWRKGDVVCRVAVFDKDSPHPQNPTKTAASYETIYEIALISKARESFATPS